MQSRGTRKPSRAGFQGKFPRRNVITAEQFRDARIFSGFTRDEAAEFLGVSLRTIGHWETGAARPSWAAFKLLRVYRHGYLIDPQWDGYRIIRGRLVTPEDHSFRPSDLAWLSLLARRGRALSDLLARRDLEQAAAKPRQRLSATSGFPEGASSYGLVFSSSTSDTRMWQMPVLRVSGWGGAGQLVERVSRDTCKNSAPTDVLSATSVG